MSKKIIFSLIAVISIFILTLLGCEESDPIESFYDKYELSHVKCNYYDNGTSRSIIYTYPQKNLYLAQQSKTNFITKFMIFLARI